MLRHALQLSTMQYCKYCNVFINKYNSIYNRTYCIVASVNCAGPQTQNSMLLFFPTGGTNPFTKSKHTLPLRPVHSG